MDMVFFSGGTYVESAYRTRETGVSIVLDSIMNAFYREHRHPIGFRAAIAILQGAQVAYLGDVCEMDVQEEIDAYTKRIRSVMDHYLEKLPAHPDIGIIGGGGAVIQNLASGHNLIVVDNPVMANAIGYCHYGILRR